MRRVCPDQPSRHPFPRFCHTHPRTAFVQIAPLLSTSYKLPRGVGGGTKRSAGESLSQSLATRHSPLATSRITRRANPHGITMMYKIYWGRGGGANSRRKRRVPISAQDTLHETRYLFTSLVSGNSVGVAGGSFAMASNSGYCWRSGSGTATFAPFRRLMSWRALTTALPR
jgi:hypothetical protein